MSSIGSNQIITGGNNRSILELSAGEARKFLLKEESYCSIDLPPYIVFADLLHAVETQITENNLSDFYSSHPKKNDCVNYTLLTNKDGMYGWRPISLIHPAIYVSLVHEITMDNNWNDICTRFKAFSQNERILCLSLPVASLGEEKDKAEQVSHWLHQVEQKSIELALDYEYIIETDMVDCYSSIYTHSIAWALHTKDTAKAEPENPSLIGNNIDNHIRNMCYGQTNGIPQGSVLMDFIAEMVLGYADLELSERIQEANADFQILRYRDDYRIFVNNPQVGEKITKYLTEVMIGLGLKLNPSKTKLSNTVIRSSIKGDKLNWMFRKKTEKKLQRNMLIIHDHSIQFPNSGSLVVALVDYYKRILHFQKYTHSLPLISIVVDIAYRNPRTYPICAATISKLLSFLEREEEKQVVIKKIKKRFSQIPNTGYMEIWLQRITLPFSKAIDYDEPICKLVAGNNVSLWNNNWISNKNLIKAINAEKIVDREIIRMQEPVIPPKEVELYISKTKGYYQ